MYGYFFIGLIYIMFKPKILTDFTNLFSPNNFAKNDKVILDYFLKQTVSMSEVHVCGIKLDHPLQFSRIK